MAFQVHIGRLSMTSPGSLQHSAGSDGKTLSIAGVLGGKEHDLSHVKYIRDQLQSMAQMDEHVPFRYDGDSSLNGYVKVASASVDVQKYLLGSISYTVEMEYVGREGDVMFESRLTGSLLENDFNVSAATVEQFHVPPGNHYAYIHADEPTSNTRTARDITSTSSSDTTTLYLKQDASLRNNNAQYIVDIEDYYKGACQISMGTHLEHPSPVIIGGPYDGSIAHLTKGAETTTNSIMCGKNANSWNVGDSLVLDNGIIKLVLGTSATTATVSSYIWDVNQYATQHEWVFSEGLISSGSQKGNDFSGWRRIQILVNKPELVIVRCTTYKNTDKSGRLVVDFSLRRGSHFATVISNYATSGTQINFGLVTAPSTAAADGTITSGYMKDGTSSPEDGNFWIVGSTAQLSTDTNLTENGIITRASSSASFPFFLGYELIDPGTSQPLGHNDAASLYSQYVDNVNEQQRLIKA
jgi:hypothetical protein